MVKATKKFTFSAPSPELAEKIYESYRLDALPDSPQVPFSKLNEDEKHKWLIARQKVTFIVSIASMPIGFMTVINRNQEVNFGFGVFQEYRRKGYMREVIPQAMEFIADLHPGVRIFSSTEENNIPARRLLEGTGFRFSKSELRGEDQYRKYEFHFSKYLGVAASEEFDVFGLRGWLAKRVSRSIRFDE